MFSKGCTSIFSMRSRVTDFNGSILGLHSTSVSCPFSETTRPALGRTSWSFCGGTIESEQNQERGQHMRSDLGFETAIQSKRIQTEVPRLRVAHTPCVKGVLRMAYARDVVSNKCPDHWCFKRLGCVCLPMHGLVSVESSSNAVMQTNFGFTCVATAWKGKRLNHACHRH